MIRRLILLICLLVPLDVLSAEQSPVNNNRDPEATLETTAAEPRDSAEDSPATVVDTKAEGADAPTDKTKRRDADIFQPSEEISEDFAVSFPVDI